MIVYLTWTASVNPTVTSYNIYRAQHSGGPWMQIAATITQTNYTDQPDTDDYWYAVSTVNPDCEGPLSTEIAAVAPDCPVPPTALMVQIDPNPNPPTPPSGGTGFGLGTFGSGTFG